MADLKAKKLEAVSRHERMKAWRTAIGASASAPGSKTPTRLAYRWLKGLAGWAASPKGADTANDEVPAEPDEFDDLQLHQDKGPPPAFMGTSRLQVFSGSHRNRSVAWYRMLATR